MSDDDNVIEVDFNPIPTHPSLEAMKRLLDEAEKKFGYSADPAIRTLVESLTEVVAKYADEVGAEGLSAEQTAILTYVQRGMGL